MQSAADQLWVINSTTDASGRCTYLDERWRGFTGQEPAEALGYGWLDVLHPDDRQKTIETLCSALDGRMPFRHEFRVRRSDGAYRWALAVGAPRFDESGAFVGYVGSIVDIDDRRAAEAALAAGEERLRIAHERLTAALRASAVALFEQDRDLRYLWIQNPAFGLDPDQVVGRTDRDLLERSEDMDALEAIKRAVLRTGAPARKEVRVLRVGASCWFDLNVEPRMSNGEIIGVLCAAIDVTERKKAAEELRRALESLELAVDAGQMGAWDLDLTRDVSGPRNLRHDQIFGYETRQGAWGAEIARRHVLEEDRAALDAAFTKAMETGELEFEARVRWPNGEVHWMAARGRVSFDDLGRPVRAAGVNFDVTGLKRAEHALIDAGRRKDEFLAILGHELRNPLAPIQYVAQLLSQTGGVEALQSDRAPVDMMKRQVEHLVRLVDDLLDISRINSGKIELRRERPEVASIVADALGMSRTHIERKGHRVENRVAPEPLVVHGDPVRLTQVVTNLVKNAAKFTPARGLIEIATAREGDEAIVRVRDNGVGIAPEMLPFVFDLFSQADSRGQSGEGGLGVGLALAQKLVDLHGGRIEAHSAGLGKGSEFVVRLPLEASLPSNAAAEAAESRSAAPLRTLVIDDNPDVADSLVMLMESFGADVRVAYDGASGIEAAADFRPDIAFVDIRMPGIDGHETAWRLRARLGKNAPTLIALTGLGQDKDRKLSREAGFDAHLTKPVSAEALEELFRREAERKRPGG